MNSSTWIIGLWILGIAISCSGGGGGGVDGDTITFQPGLTYSWIIPPQSRPLRQDGGPSDGTFDARNESPITPVGGYGHPPFYLRHSHEQLSLPNEFLISPSSSSSGDGSGGGGGFSPMPIFRQLDPAQVDCDGGPSCPNVDINRQQQQPQQQRPTTIDQSNPAAVPSLAITPPLNYWQQPQTRISFSSSQSQSQPHPHPQSDSSLGQPVSWPSFGGAGGGGGGGIGLLFFVPESASHLPVEQLIRQQLALHRTQFPIDISINCEDAVGPDCRSHSHSHSPPAVDGVSRLLLPAPPPSSLSVPRAPPATAVNERNAENGNYASLPLDGIDSGGRRGGLGSSEQNRKWRTIGERLVRNRQWQQQEQEQQERQRQRQQQQWQLQQNQQELSILP